MDSHVRDKVFSCFKPSSSYTLKNGKPVFRELTDTAYNKDSLNSIKSLVKKYPRIYEFLIDVVSPVYMGATRNQIKKFIQIKTGEEDKHVLTLNIGSGNFRISKEVVNLDIFAYDNVDIVADIVDLPFEDSSIDRIINIAVLEHVPDPEAVVKEMHRVLRPGGRILCLMPFIQGFHASPFDFGRRTKEGIKTLFGDFEVESVQNSGGPNSGFLWIFQEWLAILLSFGIPQVHRILHLLLTITTFPLKFLDALYLRHPMAHHITSSFTVVAIKKG